MAIMTPEIYCSLANAVSSDRSDAGISAGYLSLPRELLAAEREVAAQDQAAAYAINQLLCRRLLEKFDLSASRWNLPEQVALLYQQQLHRIDMQLTQEPDSYFCFSNNPFRKDLAILNHRLIPFGAELATPYSGIPRNLLLKAGMGQAARFIKAIAASGGTSPFLELHMHPRDTAAFTPDGWLKTYDNLAEFVAANPSLRGVQSTSWFLDPALQHISPHLVYLRQVPECCGATILYAGDDNNANSGAFATSRTRRELHQAGRYHPRLFTRIWPRKQLLQRRWRDA